MPGKDPGGCIITTLIGIAGSAVGLVIANRFLALFGAVGVSSALPYDFEPSIDGRVIVMTAILLLDGGGLALYFRRSITNPRGIR